MVRTHPASVHLQKMVVTFEFVHYYVRSLTRYCTILSASTQLGARRAFKIETVDALIKKFHRK